MVRVRMPLQHDKLLSAIAALLQRYLDFEPVSAKRETDFSKGLIRFILTG